ncbi:MAG: hypothetical protein Q4P15_05490 [Propionibacteriaceae bacterium]|nr:hypothetical protein [Propionibacteriaceae bacterium]
MRIKQGDDTNSYSATIIGRLRARGADLFCRTARTTKSTPVLAIADPAPYGHAVHLVPWRF